MIPLAVAAAFSRTAHEAALRVGADLRLEELLTHRQGFGLATATPVQRAFCRVADGLPLGDFATHPDVLTALGGSTLPPEERPRMLCLFSGVRTAKSQMAGALAIRATQVVDVSRLSAGEIPRVSVISLSTDKARPVMDHIRGNLDASPALKPLLVCDPTSDTITLRHPTGRPVEIRVVAGARAGGAVVARWSAGVILDEAPRMAGAEDGVVNMDDIVAGTLPRLLPGAQLVAIGSPWAPWGPAYRIVTEHWGKPSRSVVVMWCAAPLLNPVWWTPERCEEIRQSNPAAYITDVLAQFHEAIETTAIAPELIEDVVRKGDGAERADPIPGYHYTAAIDPGTRGNAWTLVVGHRDAAGCRVVDLAREWIGTPTEPLSPRAVLGEIAAIVRPYRVESVVSDQWSADALRDIAAEFGLGLRSRSVSMADKVNAVDNLRSWCVDHSISLPRVPQFVADCKRIRRKITQTGVTIELPKTQDGRHCDYAAALMVWLCTPMQDAPAEEPKGPAYGSDEWARKQADEMRKRALERNAQRKEKRWYEQ